MEQKRANPKNHPDQERVAGVSFRGPVVMTTVGIVRSDNPQKMNADTYRECPWFSRDAMTPLRCGSCFAISRSTFLTESLKIRIVAEISKGHRGASKRPSRSASPSPSPVRRKNHQDSAARMRFTLRAVSCPSPTHHEEMPCNRLHA